MSNVLITDGHYGTISADQRPSSDYFDSWSHLADELRLLDLRIHIQLKLLNQTASDDMSMNYKGLILTENEIYHLLDDPSPTDAYSLELQELVNHLSRLEVFIHKKVSNTITTNFILPLKYVSKIFELTSFEEQCLVICLAPEINRKYDKLYAYLQDDVTCKYPTIDLILKLLCPTSELKLSARQYFTPNSKLIRYFLKSADMPVSMLTREMKLEERFIDFILGLGHLDERISRFTEIYYPSAMVPALLINHNIQEKMKDFTDSFFNKECNAAQTLIFYIWGNRGSGKKLQVKHFSRDFQKATLFVDLAKLTREELPFQDSLKKIMRESILQQSLLCFYNFEILLGDGAATDTKLKQLLDEVKVFSGVVFLLADQNWKPADYLHVNLIMHIELSIPEDYERKLLWNYYGDRYQLSEELDWGAIASKFRFTPGQIEHTLITAKNLAQWRMNGDSVIGEDDIYKSCFAQVQHKLEKKSVRIIPKYSWNDIILPQEQKEELRNACNQIKYRSLVFGEWGFNQKLSYGKGLSILFSGPPGTGKTMAAEVIAKELHLEIYKIDLSQVISKYIGETEKNLQEIFYEAKLCNCILFFDETDALFGKRSEVKDSHDKYANIETAYLLQKMEEYDGITILATNFLQNIDDAFMRRINFIIKFPFPDAAYREQIWRHMYPRNTPMDENIDYKFIAHKLQMAGGNIKNIVVSSAFLAAQTGESVGMKHILSAAKHEIKKSGKLLLKEDLGEYSDIFNEA